MNCTRAIVAGCLLIATATMSTLAVAQPFNGEWDWSDAPDGETFSISIVQRGNRLEAQYCAVTQNGNKTDCDDEKDINIKGVVDSTGKSALVKFNSFFNALNGKAILKINNGRLNWHVIKSPHGGEVYAPKDAVLDRH